MDRGGRHTSGWYSRWWSALMKIVVLYLCLHSCSDKFCNCQIPEVTKEEYENRTPEEWRENWLVDTIWTCHGAELQRMGELACINDPRKISLVKRSNSEREIFLPAKLAKAFLNYRHRKDSRRRRTGKDEECCAEVQGCRWEELGEYCTLHSRAYHQSGDQP